jgi:hypothetical protein
MVTCVLAIEIQETTLESLASMPRSIRSYGKHHASSREQKLPVSLHQPEIKDSWFLDIHEETLEKVDTKSDGTLDLHSGYQFG